MKVLRLPVLRADVKGFASLAGVESAIRGATLSVFPLEMYRALGSAEVVSQVYFVVGLVSLLTALGVPALSRRVPRQRIFSIAILLYAMGGICGMAGGGLVIVALLCAAMGAATSFVCFNAYVLDCVDKAEFSKLESLRLFYSAWGWVLGPVTGVWLLSVWRGAPFLLVTVVAGLMLWAKEQMHLGGGRAIATRQPRATHPVANVRRFFSQPRLVTGWLLPLIRSSAWWFYFIYLGIFAVENGLGDTVGGLASSVANMALLLAPLMLRWLRRHSVRQAVRAGCMGSGVCFVLATLVSPFPWATVAILVAGTCCLVLLDVAGGLPFMMAVKPSERTEMSSVYSSFRDSSAIVSPALAWLVLQFFPVSAVFAAAGFALLLAWAVAGRLHPQLGIPPRQRVRTKQPDNPQK